MALSNVVRRKWRLLKQALLGDPVAMEEAVNTHGLDYVLYEPEGLPFTFSNEGVWNTVDTTTTQVVPEGKYALEFQLRWNVDTANLRISRFRLVVEGVPNDGVSATTTGTDDEVTITAFGDFTFDGTSPLDIQLQGLLEAGGGAATVSVLSYQLRWYRISDDASLPAQIKVTT